MTATKVRRAAALALAALLSITMLAYTAQVSVFAAVKPAKVTGLKATAKSSSSIQLKWSSAKNAKKYQVFRGTSKTGKFKWVKTTTNKTYTDKKLISSKTYYYKVRAVNGDVKGDFSLVKSAKTKINYAAVKVDKTNKTVTIYAKVNGKYFANSTRHLIIAKSGSGFNKGKGLLESYCSPVALYNGLVKAGGVSWSKSADKTLKDGEKISKSNAENKNFSHMDVTVTWGGQTYKLKDVLTTKKFGSSAPSVDMVFSGNSKAAKKINSGCVVCMDSCYIGIVSNMKYGLCVIDKGNPTLYGRSDMLPDDGKLVKVTFKLK